MIPNKNYNADIDNLSDKKLKHDFAKEMQFNEKFKVNKALEVEL